MTYIQCTPTQPQLIAVSRLEKSPLNARRTAAKVGMDELKASLLAHGLMQNLVVTDTGDGTYRVIATSFQRRGAGDYRLTIRAFARPKN